MKRYLKKVSIIQFTNKEIKIFLFKVEHLNNLIANRLRNRKPLKISNNIII